MPEIKARVRLLTNRYYCGNFDDTLRNVSKDV